MSTFKGGRRSSFSDQIEWTLQIRSNGTQCHVFVKCELAGHRCSHDRQGLLCQQTDSVSPYVYVFLLSWMRSVDQRFAIAGGGETSGVRHVDRGP